MISEFLSWWGRQLASLLPRLLRGHGLDERRTVLVTLTSPPGTQPPIVDILLPSRLRTRPVRQLMLDAEGRARLRTTLAQAPRAVLRLRLPAGMVLERDVTLPLAAESGLDGVLRYEMDRLTPFRAAEALWSWTVQHRDRALGRLNLRLTLASRAQLDPLLTALAEAGRAPQMIEAPAAAMAEVIRRLDLSDHLRGSTRGRRFLRLSAALCAVLACAAVALPFLRQSQALARVGAQIASLQPYVSEATLLRQRIAARTAGAGVMAIEQQQVGDPLQTLAAVTEALPDGTWLTDLTLQQRQLRIDGESSAAVQLIGRLAEEPGIENPAFTAPVTNDDRSHAELFSIGAEMRP